MTIPLLIGAAVLLFGFCLAALIVQAKKEARIEEQLRQSLAEAEAKRKADAALAVHVTRHDVSDSLRDGSF